MNKLSLIAASTLVAAATSVNAAIVAQWDFNGSNTNVTAGSGTGSASLIGGTTATFASGSASGGSSDPAPSGNQAWNTTTYSASADSGTAGARFELTSGAPAAGDLFFYFDTRHSNTASRFVQVAASRGSTTMVPVVFEAANGGDRWYNGRQVDLSSLLGGSGPIVVEVTAVHAPSTSAYAASTATSTFGSSGTLRFDMVTFDTTPIPEPATLGLLAAGSLALLRRRK